MRALKFIVLASFVLLLSSCLGDSHSTMAFDNDYIYVRTHPTYNIRCAYGYNSGSFFYHDDLSNLELGAVYAANYKVTTKDAVGDILKAESFLVVSEGKMEETQIQASTSIPESQVYPSTFEIKAGNWNEDYMGDKWVFSYKVPAREGERYIPNFYFNIDDQVDRVNKNGDIEEVPLEANQVIIDVIFVKANEVIGDGSVKDLTFETVGNLSSLRKFLTQYYGGIVEYNSEGYAEVIMKFRFIKQTTGEPVEYTEGTFNTSSGSGVYYPMLFFQE